MGRNPRGDNGLDVFFDKFFELFFFVFGGKVEASVRGAQIFATHYFICELLPLLFPGCVFSVSPRISHRLKGRRTRGGR